MKQMIERNALDQVTGGRALPYIRVPLHGKSSSGEKAKEEEPELSIEVSSHPRGLLGEIEDANDRMMDVLQRNRP